MPDVWSMVYRPPPTPIPTEAELPARRTMLVKEQPDPPCLVAVSVPAYDPEERAAWGKRVQYLRRWVPPFEVTVRGLAPTPRGT